ncbi:MAG: hypothetical protein IIW37_04595, partial [Bacteroidaceae bacterium]|nr:hypothetical protein [Bacteroidaceae bacterium]
KMVAIFFFFFYILVGKVSARREQDKTKALVFVFYAEPPPNLGAAKACKARAGQNKSPGFCFSRRAAAQLQVSPKYLSIDKA